MIENYFSGVRDFLPGHWNELNKQENRRELKIDCLYKMLAIDKTDENQYILNYYDCYHFTKNVLINFSGLENFENFDEKEFYESYGATNARFNIPVYYLHTKVKDSPNVHASCIVYLGPENGPEKDDLLEKGINEKQWYIFEPQSDYERVFGNQNFDTNDPANISGFTYLEIYDIHNLETLMAID
jgi:hypothetical protein